MSRFTERDHIFRITWYNVVMTGPSTEAREGLRRMLMEVRRGLLGLHKELIIAEQLTYERINGRVGSTGQLLQLVLNDPWFTWLHPLSQLVIRVDELLDEGE